MKKELTQINTGFTGKSCYTHARCAILESGFGVMTTQPIRLNGIDVFYGTYLSHTTDNGKSWSALKPSATLTRQKIGENLEMAICDTTPIYHEKSGKILLIGHSATYLNDEIAPHQRRYTLYSVYDEATGDFAPFKKLDTPLDKSEFYQCGSGSAQCLILPDGDILVPVYHLNEKDAIDPWGACYSAAVIRCRFDGENLSFVEMGNSLSLPTPRGLYEPSLIKFRGEYFLTMRNDLSGYTAKSADGLHFDEPHELVWDSGENVGNYNTQQHWLTLGDKLYLVYTRRAADNDNVPRHRAPLFISEFDTERFCLIKNTESITVPNRGARLGNFGCQSRPGAADAFIYVAEWMQTTEPDPYDYKKCMKYGSDNSIFVVRLYE